MRGLLGHSHPDVSLLGALDIPKTDIGDEQEQDRQSDFDIREPPHGADQLVIAVVQFVQETAVVGDRHRRILSRHLLHQANDLLACHR